MRSYVVFSPEGFTAVADWDRHSTLILEEWLTSRQCCQHVQGSVVLTGKVDHALHCSMLCMPTLLSAAHLPSLQVAGRVLSLKLMMPAADVSRLLYQVGMWRRSWCLCCLRLLVLTSWLDDIGLVGCMAYRAVMMQAIGSAGRRRGGRHGCSGWAGQGGCGGCFHNMLGMFSFAFLAVRQVLRECALDAYFAACLAPVHIILAPLLVPV